MTEPTRIYVWNNDALQVVGDFDLRDAKGGEFKQHGKVRLCRCGISNTKPYCDNSHIRVGFQSEVRAE